MPPRRPWSELPLVLRFLAAGGMVMLAAMLLIGVWITARIEQSVVDNTASAAALYLESFVSPLSQELASSDTLSDPAMRALREVFSSTGMGERIVSFKIWKPGGLVVHASDPAIIGNRFPPSEELQAAWRGQVSGSFSDLDDAESAAEAVLGLPLLEVYSPIHEVWSGEIIAVAEFYEVATELEQDLADARRTSWLLVAAVFTVSGLMLLGIVRSGGRTIDRQRAMLQAQIAESREIAAQNADLRRRAIGATARATAQTEASLRRASADLHDGPAQLIALAAMRLESVVPDTEPGRQEAAALRDALQSALTEIRTISRGLSLPDLGGLPLADVARRAVEAHQRQTESAGPADLARPGESRLRRFLPDLPLPLPAGGPVERRAPRRRRTDCRVRRSRARGDSPSVCAMPVPASIRPRRRYGPTAARASPDCATAPRASAGRWTSSPPAAPGQP